MDSQRGDELTEMALDNTTDVIKQAELIVADDPTLSETPNM